MANLAAVPKNVGQKAVYLPTAVIKMIYRPDQPPTTAVFQVPLRWTKLDMRSYLRNAYGLETTAIRSFIQHGKLLRFSYHPRVEGAIITTPKLESRQKRMYVDFEKPFVWPEEPTDFGPWNQTFFNAFRDASSKEQRGEQWREGNKKEENDVPGDVLGAYRQQRLKAAKDGWQGASQDSEGPMYEVIERYKEVVQRRPKSDQAAAVQASSQPEPATAEELPPKQ